jgi:predicted Zn-dependent protease
VKQAAALAQQYGNCGYDPEALITMLGKIACRDNFTEMHAFKHHQATYEEFYSTRPSLRWRHLVSAVQAAAISHGRIQDVYEHAAEVMHF